VSAGPPVSSNKSEKTRQRILDAAARTFRDKGYFATTLNDIAHAARLRAGSIYYHFESKEQILEEVLDIGIVRISEAVIRDVGSLPPAATPAEKIRVGIETHLRTLLQHGPYSSASLRVFGQAPRSAQRRNLRLRAQYADFWRELLNEAREAGEIDGNFDLSLIRMFLFGALNWTVEWYKPGKRTLSEFAEEVCTILFHGVGHSVVDREERKVGEDPGGVEAADDAHAR
jgi:TetR/AcrR family transcriptional regulator, cholesterol catabolism regulator